MPSTVMEDHQEAYFVWRDLGIRGATCVHVDAHLDVSNFKVPGYGLLEAPELNCANFLHRAIREGLVERLIWVIPPHLPGDATLLDWTRDELQNWMHLSLVDHASLTARGARVEGTLAGARFTVCTCAHLPHLEGQVLLDIDVDYYLGPHDELWQTPLQLSQALGQLHWQTLTVALSVIGGYTPLPLRYLGELTRLAFEEPDEARRIESHLESGLVQDLPLWAQAAHEARQAVEAGEDHFGPGWDRAVALDPGYRANVFDVAAFHFMRHRHLESRAWLERAQGELIQPGLYLGALMAMRERSEARALEAFETLLREAGMALEPRNRGHLLEMAGRCLVRLGRPQEACERFREALRLDAADAPVWRELARAQRAAGDAGGAARSLRKAIGLAPADLASAEARLELAQLYGASGQVLLAQAELQQLDRPEVPPDYRLEAQRLGLKLRSRRP